MTDQIHSIFYVSENPCFESNSYFIRQENLKLFSSGGNISFRGIFIRWTRQSEPELELTLLVYNINLGQNQELLEACCLLKEYAQYVELVRKFAREESFAEAVEHAVDYCIGNGILAEFLSKNRAEAIAVSIFEYDEEKHMKNEREEWRAKGEERAFRLMQYLTDLDRSEELKRALSDREYREQLYREYSL